MITVPSREVKNRLGKYLRLVRQGETVCITDRGKPVACILPAGTAEDREWAETLSALTAKGNVRLGTGEISGRGKPTVLKPGASVAEMVSEDRR